MGFRGSGLLSTDKRTASGPYKLHEPHCIVFHPVVIKEHISRFFVYPFLELLQISVGILVGKACNPVKAEVLNISIPRFVLEGINAVDQLQFFAKLEHQFVGPHPAGFPGKEKLL